MEAHTLRRSASAGLTLVLCLAAAPAPTFGATHRTRNFVVTARTDEIAKQVGEVAEQSRRELAQAWLGKVLPDWYRPCPIRVKDGQIGAGGKTTFTFDRGEVSGWNMDVQGTVERILDSVVPHEVSHTILASHFRRPLPRWADEGAATLIEHPSEQKRQEIMLNQVINTPKRIPLPRLLELADYPSDMQQVYTLYAEGYSLANFLVQRGGENGRPKFLNFLQDAHQTSWAAAIRKHYQFDSVASLETTWTSWVTAGSPPVRDADDARLAQTEPAQQPPSAAASPSTQNAPVQTAALQTSAAPIASVSLQPLDGPVRPLRQGVAASLTAPTPGDDSRDGAAVAAASSAVLAQVDAPAQRIVPRRDAAPGFNSPASIRLQQLMAQQAADTHTDTISAARAALPPARNVERAQSASDGSWSDYSGFPSEEGSTNRLKRWFNFD